MLRIFVFLTIAGLGTAVAEVRIHDPVVSLLAKPYGIEERIQLESIDALYSAPNGDKRLVFTLRNSGVKEVRLRQPDFSLDIVMPDGRWASLGSLGGCSICFPVTGDSETASRTYVAALESGLGSDDLETHLRRTAASGRQVRLVGTAEMLVVSDDRVEFSKKNLKLEVHGPLKLSRNFRARSRPDSADLPGTGLNRAKP